MKPRFTGFFAADIDMSGANLSIKSYNGYFEGCHGTKAVDNG